MKLGEFLSGATATAPGKPVKFKIFGGKVQSSEKVFVDVEAVLTFVSEDERQAANCDAQKHIKLLYGDVEPPANAFADEVAYQILFRSLRDSQSANFAAPFADTIIQLRKVLAAKPAKDLYVKYLDFVYEEFPDDISPDELEALTKDAEKKSFAVLLSEYEFSKIVRALPSLADRFGK